MLINDLGASAFGRVCRRRSGFGCRGLLKVADIRISPSINRMAAWESVPDGLVLCSMLIAVIGEG